MKLTKEQRTELFEDYEKMFSNPLNMLPVYSPFRALREYYYFVIHKNMNRDLRQEFGRMMWQKILDCNALMSRCQFGTPESKLAATEEFLHNFNFLVSGVEFLVEHPNLGISIRQATEMALIIRKIENEMGGFKKYLGKLTGETLNRDAQSEHNTQG